MNLKTTFLLLCFAGIIVPMTQFIPWVLENGLNVPLLIQELFSTRIGAFFGLDVIVSAIVLVVFVLCEGKRLSISNLWIPVAATFCVGVSFGLPLFLYMRQSKIES